MSLHGRYSATVPVTLLLLDVVTKGVPMWVQEREAVVEDLGSRPGSLGTSLAILDESLCPGFLLFKTKGVGLAGF